jgi:hypothetical protein
MLRSNQILWRRPTQVVIDWWRTPKGRRGDPFRQSRYVVIEGPETPVIAAILAKLRTFTQLTNVSSLELGNMWMEDPDLHEYTASSIKRGAITHLDRLVAGGLEINPVYRSRLFKHSNPADPEPRITVRYGGDRLAKARSLKTQRVTRHL